MNKDRIIEKLIEITLHVGCLDSEFNIPSLVSELNTTNCAECTRLASELQSLESSQDESKEVSEFELLNHFLTFVSDKAIATMSKREIIENYLSSKDSFRIKSDPQPDVSALFKKVYVKGKKGNLPKEDGLYTFGEDNPDGNSYDCYSLFYYREDTDTDWVNMVDWYLLPIASQVREAFEPIQTGGAKIPMTEQGKEEIYDIDFAGHCMAWISIKNNSLTVIGAINGWGDGISDSDIRITKRVDSAKPEIKQQ